MSEQHCHQKKLDTLLLLLVSVIILLLAGVATVDTFGTNDTITMIELRGNLIKLQQALLAYKADHGHFPCSKVDHNFDGDTAEFKQQLLWFTDAAGKPSMVQTDTFCFGPYLSEFPVEPVSKLALVDIRQFGTQEEKISSEKKYHPSGGWCYKADTGMVVVNSDKVYVE